MMYNLLKLARNYSLWVYRSLWQYRCIELKLGGCLGLAAKFCLFVFSLLMNNEFEDSLVLSGFDRND